MPKIMIAIITVIERELFLRDQIDYSGHTILETNDKEEGNEWKTPSKKHKKTPITSVKPILPGQHNYRAV